MADTILKYVSLANLTKYDEKIKEHIVTADNTLKSNLEGQVEVVATALDGEIARAKAAEQANATAASNAQTDVDNLEAYVGTFTASEGVDTVVKYIDAKTANIASDETVSALDKRVTQAEKDIGAIEADYLKDSDKTELQGSIDAVDAKVGTLIGEDANKSVRTIANEELAKQLIPENAQESLNTLQEIAQWIQNHPSDVSAMNAAITALQNKVDTGDKTVSAYVTDAINALSIGDYAKAADLTTLASRVSELETVSATHALKSEVEAVSTSLTEYKDAHKDDYTNSQIDEKIKVNTDAIVALGNTYATDAELATAIENEVTRANGAYAAKSLETTVSEHKADIVAHITADERTLWNGVEQRAKDYADGLNTAMTTKVDGAIDRIAANETAISGLNTTVATKAAQSDLESTVARVATLESWHENFEECSEEDINALFTA